MQLDFDVFTSHATRSTPDERAYVDGVVSELRRFGLLVFLDRDSLPRGSLLIPELESAVARSRAGLLFLTRRSRASGWVALELEQFALRQQRGSFPAAVIVLEQGPSVPELIRWSLQITIATPTTPSAVAQAIDAVFATTWGHDGTTT